MARKIKTPADTPAFWPLEAEPAELQEYITSRIRGTTSEQAWDGDVPIEPDWFRESFDDIWQLILAEARFSPVDG